MNSQNKLWKENTMSKLGETKHTIIPPDRQAFDEVRITTVPRYKMSGLSGNEWRISAKIEFLYKGKVVFETGAGDVHWAIAMLQSHYIKQNEPIPYNPTEFWDKYCNQEGCKNPPTITYKLKNRYCNEGHKTQPYQIELRHFCEEHKIRGDCGLEDADTNYELVENKLVS